MRSNQFDPEKALNAILWIAKRVPSPHSIRYQNYSILLIASICSDTVV